MVDELSRDLTSVQLGDQNGDASESSEAGRGITLSWLGRRQARVSIPKPRILEAVPEHSDPTEDDPGNLVIEGDNRQAMVSLLPQYAGRVDVVLIDPPYNTGKSDFRYNDARFKDPDADTRDGAFVSAEDGGRHAKWLNQMAPTLRILRDLLAPHGVIFVHINDIELPRLLMLMEEIYGETNRLGILVWRGAVENNPSQIAMEHEYIVVFAKDITRCPAPWKGRMNELVQQMNEEFARLTADYPDLKTRAAKWKAWIRAHRKELPNALGRKTEVDERGPYQPDGDLSKPEKGGYFYDVLHPVTGQPVKVPLRGWRVPPDTMERLRSEDRLVFGRDHTTVANVKRYLAEDQPDILRSVIEIDSRAAFYEMKVLFPENPAIFRNPKSVALEEYLLSFVAARDAIVLDCFAGSGTTGHAVMRLNKQDSGQRRFILVEEGSEGDSYATTLTAERLRRARRIESLSGGFSFLRVGRRIDTEAFEQLQREGLVSAILQTDASGRGGGIKAVEGRKWVIGYNTRREAICLHYDPKAHSPVSAEALRQMYFEVDELGLKRPLRVYGETCEIFGSDSFRFFKLPDEVTDNLTMALKGAP